MVININQAVEEDGQLEKNEFMSETNPTGNPEVI